MLCSIRQLHTGQMQLDRVQLHLETVLEFCLQALVPAWKLQSPCASQYVLFVLPSAPGFLHRPAHETWRNIRIGRARMMISATYEYIPGDSTAQVPHLLQIRMTRRY